MLTHSEKQLKEYILTKKLADAKKLAEAEALADSSKKGLEDAVVKSKLFTPRSFNAVKAEFFRLPVADLSEQPIDPKVLGLLSQKVAQNYQMLILGRQGDNIQVGLVDPGNFQAHEAAEFLATQNGLSAQYFALALQDFYGGMSQYSGFKKEIGSALESAKERFSQKEDELAMLTGEAGGDLEATVKSAPVAKIVSVIIKHAIDGRASDIHIEPGRNEGRVRYRVDGILHSSITVPAYLYTSLVSRIKVMANLKLDETRLPQDGRIRVQLDGREADLRVSILPTLGYEKVVMRVMDTSAGVPNLLQLGFSDYHIKKIENSIKRPFGLFLLTGPTGSGKTTTLYSVLNMLNAEDANITTLEDPVEYYIDGVNQSQINPEIGYSFANGLRAILRQDPNIIMVGEIRDNDTVELAIHASLTGHLVFSTLHTNNAWGAVPRLIDMKAEPFLLVNTINLVMAQRLVRKICPDCREEIKLAPAILQRLEEEIAKIPKEFTKNFPHHVFFHGKGCANCGSSGYAGRTVVGEIFEFTQEIKDLIIRSFGAKEVGETLAKQDFVSLRQDGLLKALTGLTTVDEVFRVSEE